MESTESMSVIAIFAGTIAIVL